MVGEDVVGTCVVASTGFPDDSLFVLPMLSADVGLFLVGIVTFFVIVVNCFVTISSFPSVTGRLEVLGLFAGDVVVLSSAWFVKMSFPKHKK